MLKKLKDQRGMTLIELLAVIVILAIISAIAIPSILGLIGNSKKDAHVANARQMINSAKIAVSGDSTLQPANGTTIYVSLKYLQDKGYIETVKDPESSGSYTSVAAYSGGTKPTDGSFVQIDADGTGKLSYSVYLTDGAKSIGSAATPTAEDRLSRSSVTP